MEEDNLETFSLVWLNTTRNNSQEILDIEEKLRSLLNYIKIYNNEYECENYIKSRSDDDRIIFIINEELAKEFIPRIHQLRQISSIYIFNIKRKKIDTWINQYSKIKSIIKQSNEIISQIEYNIRRINHMKIDEPLSISIFDKNFNNNHNNNELTCLIDNEFLYSQLLINSLLKMKIFLKDKNQFINLSKNFYKQNENELIEIKKFEKEYSSFNALQWLTKNSFISRIINKALRKKNFNILFLCRFFLQDILKQIEQNKTIKFIRVYRSLLISNDELNIYKNLIGKLISINSFFFTHINRKKSLSFLKESINNNNDLHKILFEIDANPKLSEIKPFANITSFNYINQEQQILFPIGTIFRILSIHQDTKQIHIIRMELSNFNQEEFNLLSFGQTLIDMKKFNEANIYFHHLLDHLPFKHLDIPICYHALANISLEKHQYDSSIKWFKKLIEIKIEILDSNHSDIASIYNNMGLIYIYKNDFKQALDYYHMALKIFQNKYLENDSHIIDCYNNIAMIYKNDKKFQQSLEYYMKILSIKEKYLSQNHPDLAISHTNIAIVNAHINQHDLALEHFNHALHIYENILPYQHSLISFIFENIANIYYDKGQYRKSLGNYEKAFKIYHHLLPSTHPDVLQIQMSIKRSQSKLKHKRFYTQHHSKQLT